VDLRELVPRDKSDVDRAQAAVAAGFPAVESVLDRLVEWLQDANWPVATVLIPFLQSVGSPLVPHIWNVLNSDDLLWKYWVIALLIPALPRDAAALFRVELERLSYQPEPSERREELDQQASLALQKFGWERPT
jgi:Domain of unknown function (DUF5071)